jgi:UDP-N-acetylmuramyl pentapeptide phosphotransferase/UDP-N-acetylglucosamine-1-phosphate transferase
LVCTLVALRASRGVLSATRLARSNYRGRLVAGTLGIVLVTPLIAGGVISLAAPDVRARSVAGVVGAALAMAVLGLIDDVYGSRRAGGLLGHARALLHGTVTTGAIKAAGGAVVGLVAAWLVGWSGWWVLVAGAVVALGSNLANLLDLRPGRACKFWLIAWGALLAGTGLGTAQLVTTGLAGGVAGFLPADLHERGMLGDVGAGLLGAALSTAAVASMGKTPLLACLGVLAALTLLSEAVSFGRLIEATPLLRLLDGIGRIRG